MKLRDLISTDSSETVIEEGIENYVIGHVNSMGMSADLYQIDKDISLRKVFNLLSLDTIRGLLYPDNRLIVWDADRVTHDVTDGVIRRKLFTEYNNASVQPVKLIIELKKDENNHPVLGVYFYSADIKSDVLFERLKPHLKSMRNCSIVLFYDINSHKFLKMFNLS